MKDNKKTQNILVIIGIILQTFGLIINFYVNTVLSLICIAASIIVIVSSFVLVSD